jgi:multiple sugar transport system substrate-binding protein
MTELEFSIMYTKDDVIEALRLALEDFEKFHRIRVRLRILSWDTAWSELLKVALYKSGPDVSEIGTSWVGSFISMDVLRQFSKREISTWGRPSVFLPSSWQTRTGLDEAKIWAIPWLTDTRVIYYRRDLLQQAGIDEQTAFQTSEQFMDTLHHLQESSVAIPLAIPTAQQQLTLHILASWVWTTGGRFISPDGRHVLFHRPEAREGMKAYFDLRRYLVPAAHNLTDNEINILFGKGEVAIIITGHWELNVIKQREVVPGVIDNLGMAIVPGMPFVGGSDLVVWKRSRQAEAAIALIRHLISQPVQTNAIASKGLLPARCDVFDAPPFTTDPYYRVISESLKKGRGFRATYMWGLIEDKLTATVSKMWTELLANPELGVEEVINQHIEPLARELNHTLAA